MRLIKILLCLLLVGGGLLEARCNDNEWNHIDTFYSRKTSLATLSDFIGESNIRLKFANKLNGLMYEISFGFFHLNAQNTYIKTKEHIVELVLANYEIESSISGESNKRQREILTDIYSEIVKESLWDIECLKEKGFPSKQIQTMQQHIEPFVEASIYLQETKKGIKTFDYDEWAKKFLR